MDAVAIASIALVGTVVGPLLLTYLTGRQRHRDKEQDWARQDTVAARLEKRQDATAAKTAEVARLLVQTDQRATRTAEGIDGQLRQIHGLVNANLSKAIADQLEATEQQLVLLREVGELHRSAGREPSPDALAAIKRIDEKVSRLRAQVADRAMQTLAANAQVTNGT